MASRLLTRFRPAPRTRSERPIVTGDEPLLDQELLTSLQRLALSAPRVQRGTFAGEHRSRRRGAAPEFADFKSYSPGDDIRRVDWNLYARFDELFVRLSEVTTDLTVHLLLDASASMEWRATPHTPTKYRFAQKVAAALAYVGLAKLDRVSIVPFGGKTRDSEFARRQRLDAREHRPARPPTGSNKFIAGPPGKRSRTGVVGQLKTPPERVTGVHRVAVPSDGGTPLDKCTGEFEPSGRLLEQAHRLAQERLAVGPRRHHAGHPGGRSEYLRQPGRLRQL